MPTGQPQAGNRVTMADSVEIVLNGTPRQIAAGESIAQLLERLELKGRHVAVEVNRELVPRSQHPGRRLAAGDRLEIVTLVGGG